MKRFPLYVFGGLVVATIAAFFITQHLKVSTPIVGGYPNPDPGAINPAEGRVCPNGKGVPVSHRFTRISFYLQNRSDDVNVYVVNGDGDIVDQVASGVHMQGGKHPRRHLFSWDGRQSDGTIAPDGNYNFRVALIHQGRAVNVGGPITVKTTPAHPVITSVSPNLIPQAATPVTIRFKGTERQPVTILIYRTDLGTTPRLVDSLTTTHRHFSSWDGTIHGTPAPAGTYLVGLRVTDVACNIGSFPVVLPPPPGSTPHAGVTVRYLAADPPPTPVQAGVRAIVFVDSRTRPYRWTLSEYGARKPIATGNGSNAQLSVRMPRSGPGLYELYVRSGGDRTAVPLVSNAASHRARILVVLPSLTWEGQILGDEDGDGVPDSLDAGVPVGVNRVFANGLPAGLPDEEAFLAYLNKAHLAYDLTTDVGLIEGDGPALQSYKGVVFAGSERWVPASLVASLQAYVQHGGNVLSLGLDSLRRKVTLVRSGAAITQALDPTPPSNPDALGANIGPVVDVGGGLSILTIADGLGIFRTTSGVFQGFHSYQQITPTSKPLSSAGPSTASAVAIAGYKLDSGTVVEIGLVGFEPAIARSVDAQELINRLWSVLSR